MLATAVVCLLVTAVIAAPPVDPATIHTVHVVQSCHLDMGFADFSTNIINRFFYEHFPLAIKTAAALKQRGGDEALTFAVRPMLLSLYLNCPAHFPHLPADSFPWSSPFATMTTPRPLRCPNSTEIAAVREAITQGTIVFDAFPVSAEPELFSAELFSAGLQLVADLAVSLNVSKPTTLSQRDVPGMTRAVVPLLQANGVTAISVGVNGGSAAPDLPGYSTSRAAQLSTPFVWKDEQSGSSVLVHSHPGGYGRLRTESGEGLLSSCMATAALPGQALCLNFRGDNAGPPLPDEVLEDWKMLRAAFPNASTIKSAKFDDYFEQLDSPDIRAQLPVVTSEVGDTWVYGCASDPLKLATFQVLQRHHALCVHNVSCVSTETEFKQFERLLLLVGKHTWGGHTIIEDDGSSADTTHYTAKQLAQVRWSSKGFITQQLSWDEMRLQLWAVRDALGADSALGQAIDTEMQQLTGPAAVQPFGQRWNQIPRDQWGSQIELGGFELRLDPRTGAIVSLRHSNATHNWASAVSPLGRFAYATHSERQAEQFFVNYSYGCPHCGWAREAFTKPGVSPNLANASVTHGTVTQMRRKGSDSRTPEAVSYKLSLPQVLVEHYGAPRSVFVEIAVDDTTGCLTLALRWLNKTTTRLPESIWMEFQPADTTEQVLLSKMNSLVDVQDVVVNGSSLHSIDHGGVLFAAASGMETLRVTSPLSPLVATREQAEQLSLWKFPISKQRRASSGVVAFNLFNNLWNTNYIYWYPWRNASASEDDSAMTFKWTLDLHMNTN